VTQSLQTHRDIPAVHPGEILKEEFLEEYGLSQYALAKRIGVPALRINAIVLGKRGISADTALRLGRFFGTSPRFWLNLQNHFDLETVEDELGTELERAIPVRADQLPRTSR
jgi:addiction module HigA family antidote